MEEKSLLLGCGNSRAKKMHISGQTEWKGKLVAVDMNPACTPDLCFDIDVLPLPFMDGEFDEIGAFDVLEHLGRQGDWRRWFREWGEYHRILKPGGMFYAIVPLAADAHADPGHTRFISLNWFMMLNQSWYDTALGIGMQVTDYRWFWKHNFDIAAHQNVDGHHLAVALRKTP